MKYTHYWKILDFARWTAIWPQLIANAVDIGSNASVPLSGMSCRDIKAIFEAPDVKVDSQGNAGNTTSQSRTTFSDKEVSDNDDDDDDYDYDAPLRLSVEDSICINGKSSNERETFIFGGHGPIHTNFSCYETARKPCDLVVAMILLRAEILVGHTFSFSSDESWGLETELRESQQSFVTHYGTMNCQLNHWSLIPEEGEDGLEDSGDEEKMEA